ncbi:MAG: tetratricopeptide repeat protein [Anaerolineales bacterium]
MSQSKWLVPTIILILLVVLLAPIFITGYSQAHQADLAMADNRYQQASDAYARAARFLFWRADLWEKAGIAAGTNGNFTSAIEFLERASQHSEQGWVVLGYSYFKMNDFPSCLQAYQQGLTYYPSSASLYSGLALLHRTQKDWQAEQADLQNQLSFDQNNAPAHYRLGLLLTVFDSEQALNQFTAASSLDPQFDPAMQTFRTALGVASTQADEAQQLVTRGRALGLVNEWELALVAFDHAVKSNAENAEAWAWLGEAQQQTGGDGSDALNQAIAIDDQSAIIRALRALHWSRIGFYDRMAAEYALAARAEPNNPTWQAGMGDAYVKQGDLAAGLEAYKRATEIAPNDPVYWRLLALLCAEHEVAIDEIGLPAAQKAVELAPKDVVNLDALGYLYYLSGRYATAEETLKNALTLEPRAFSVHIHLAMNYLAQGNRSAANDELIYVRDRDVSGADGERAKELLSQYFP